MSVMNAVFLDRDGTIIVDAHYLSDPADVVLLPKVREGLSLLRDAGFLLFILTNQSGIGRGYFDLEAVNRCNRRMIELLDLPGPLFTEMCIAPEAPTEPAIYRKPSPRFIQECVVKYGLDPAGTWMVGDKSSDVETGVNAGINVALIAPASVEPLRLPEIARYESLYAFAQAVAKLAR